MVIPAQAGIWIRYKGIFNFIAGFNIYFSPFSSPDSCIRRNDDKSVSVLCSALLQSSFQ
jgi:hypothetical protein